MKQTFLVVLILTFLFHVGCSPSSSGDTAGNANNSVAPTTNSNTEGTAAKTPADGLYQGKGVVTKINNDLGSVEIDHENIPDLMPAMKMEFSVKNKAMLKPIAVGDAVTFTIEYKQGTEIIIAIGK